MTTNVLGYDVNIYGSIFGVPMEYVGNDRYRLPKKDLDAKGIGFTEDFLIDVCDNEGNTAKVLVEVSYNPDEENFYLTIVKNLLFDEKLVSKRPNVFRV